jgi:predicted DCC family thiol-disulfide oxidoreductase YuxK
MNDAPDRPLLVFDGDCSFCRSWVDYWQVLTGERASYVPYQEIGNRFPDFPREDFSSAVTLFLPSGDSARGAHAVFTLLALLPEKRWMLWLYRHVPGFSSIAEGAYRTIAQHRNFFFWVTRALWGIPLKVETFSLATWLFLRLLGAVYLLAFASFATQMPGLIGSQGISPVADFLHSLREVYGNLFWQLPTVFWLSASDAMIRAVCVAGICLSVLQLLGVRWRIVRVALFVLYLSLVTGGQEFMGYQWDALLLEAGFLAILLGYSPIIVWLYRWLFFRLIFLSGVVKLASGDPSWRQFTALPVHYETQPLPTPLAWYMFQLPTWFQRFSVGFLFFVELLVPFLIFAPRRLRFFAAGLLATLQVLILLTGNYAFFNLLTIGFCLFLMDDECFHRWFRNRKVALATSSGKSHRWSRAVCTAFASLAVFVGGFQVARPFGVRWSVAEMATRAVSPFQIINSYGLFAVMTTARLEIVIEGSNDGVNWTTYEFKYKPGDISRRPPWVAPHQPRLDWQMWFAALGEYQSDPCFVRFMVRILQGSSEVLRLMERNPFPDGPPRYIRARLYQYRFTTPSERKNTGRWWSRELKGVYMPAGSLRN